MSNESAPSVQESKVHDIDLTDDQIVSYLKNVNDNTVYWELSPENQAPKLLCDYFRDDSQNAASLLATKAISTKKSLESFNQQIELLIPINGSQTEAEKWKLSSARACICKSYGGRYLSGTFRSADKPAPPTPEPEEKPVDSWKCSRWGKTAKYVLETFELIDGISKSIWPGGVPEHPSGLIVFAGSTSAGKTQLAQAFSLHLIREAVKKKKGRRPHLVTFEDPIEPWFLSNRISPLTKENEEDSGQQIDKNPKACLPYGFCFTPRQERIDTQSLSDSLADAKRQTPACFYAGEVRDGQWWKQIIEFAGSGHIVVATTHAGRLPETMSRIIEATKATTPAARRNIGAYIAALVHLEKVEVTHKHHKPRDIILPAIWAHRGAALASLVGDGLSSVTPNRDYVLARSHFLEQQFQDKITENGGRQCLPTGHRTLEGTDLEFLMDAIVVARTLDMKDLLQQ